MDHWELPLVLFTVLGQWAIGIAIILALLDQFQPNLAGGKASSSFRWAGISVFPICALALLFSIFHLGQPFAAYRAMSNFGSSWLSREILAFIALGILTLIYSYIWWKQPEKTSSRRAVGLLTAGVGIAAVIASSQVYTMPAHSAWNSWETSAAFLLTAILLGSLTLFALLTWKNEIEEKPASVNKTVGWAIILALVGIILSIASFAQSYGASTEQANAVAITFSSWIFWFRMLFGIVLPGALGLRMISGAKETSKQLIMLTFVGTLLGELGGRALFYYAVMSQMPF